MNPLLMSYGLAGNGYDHACTTKTTLFCDLSIPGYSVHRIITHDIILDHDKWSKITLTIIIVRVLDLHF